MKFDRSTHAVVTGAGSGLGRAFAKELASRGAAVVASDLRLDTARATAEEIAAHGGKAHALACDVTKAEDVRRLAEESAALVGDVSLLINNAGIGAGGDVGVTTLTDWHKVIDANLWGVIHGCHAFVPAMRARRAGHIVNVASIAAIASAPRTAAYNVSKAAVVALSETLAAEAGKDGVGVTVVCPSFFWTNILQDAVGVADEHLRKTVVKLTAKSKLSAADIARLTLDGAKRGRLYIMPHAAARWIWRLKRLAPSTYAKLIGRLASGPATGVPQIRRSVGRGRDETAQPGSKNN